MLTLGALGFASPWLLLAGLGLPAIWWLLRVTPPAPLLVRFPPAFLILGLRSREDQPARTPIWLTILRMVLAALIILGLAEPVLDPAAPLRGSGPLVLIVDNGWASAQGWERRRQAWKRLLDQAGAEGRPVRIAATARSRPDSPAALSDPLRAEDARKILRALRPVPWSADYDALRAAVESVTVDGQAHVVWLSDGLDGPGAYDLAAQLQRLGGLEIMTGGAASAPLLVDPPDGDGGGFDVALRRAGAAGTRTARVRAVDPDGRVLARGEAGFVAGETRAGLRLDLPREVRREVARLHVEGQETAGGVFLLDDRWRRRPVGAVSGGSTDADQPLLGTVYYLERALGPYHDVVPGDVAALTERELSVVFIADIGKLGRAEQDRLSAWIEQGGVLVRFAGPKLAQGADALLPVALRKGGRALGGSLSWTHPARLAPFSAPSPFVGLDVPGDVRVKRQVLAQPSFALDERTWARLTDGTPLVTAARRGDGWLVLFHVTANMDWSNLPISGLFVNMLRRIVDLSRGVAGHDPAAALPLLAALDGFGVLGDPPAGAAATISGPAGEARAAPGSPPGYYGSDGARRALNLSPGIADFAPLDALPAGVARSSYAGGAAVPLRGWLLLAALLLAVADTSIGLALRGLLRPSTARLAAVLLLVAAGPDAPSRAQTGSSSAQPADADAPALRATLETRLAHVLTGDRRVDSIARDGLAGLGKVLRQRTSVEPGPPLGVRIEADELAFYPVLYWPVSTLQSPPSERAMGKLNRYLRTGGMILFDTRDRGDTALGAPAGTSPAARHLRRLVQGLDIPMLTPIPRDHVLTRSFYLLSDFPGRWTGGRLWVERRGGQHNDGVSSVVVGANDWAAAWAVDSDGRPRLPVVPGGEGQREYAYRFGVNWVMYALTGNYKADQVHVPAIMERLGQ